MWLCETPFRPETEMVAKLKTFPALCPLMGMYDGSRYPSFQKFELEIQGVFRADYVARHERHFVLIEFEGAEAHSIFGPGGTNQMRHWGRQIQHGFSQIADWSWAKNESRQSRIFQSALGTEDFTETYVLLWARRFAGRSRAVAALMATRQDVDSELPDLVSNLRRSGSAFREHLGLRSELRAAESDAVTCLPSIRCRVSGSASDA